MEALLEYVEDVLLEEALRRRCPSGPAMEWPVQEDEAEDVGA